MSNELSIFKPNNTSLVSADELETFSEVAKASEFLPRIQLITKGKYVDTGKIKPGHWGVPQTGGEEIEDLGEVIDIIPLDYRPKALDVSDKEAIITVYDVKDPEFQRIKKAPKNSGCMWGPSFLVLERSTGLLYELFFGNKSGRAEADKMKPFLPQAANKGVPSPARLKIHYKKGPDYGWHVPVIIKCSEPFSPEQIKVDDAKIADERWKFRNPPKGTEKVDESEANTQKRAR